MRFIHGFSFTLANVLHEIYRGAKSIFRNSIFYDLRLGFLKIVPDAVEHYIGSDSLIIDSL